MIGPFAARRVLGQLAVAGAPAVPSGPTVLLDDGFTGAAGTLNGTPPDTTGANLWVVTSGDVRRDGVGAGMAYAFTAGHAFYDLGAAATTLRWTLYCDGSTNDRLFTHGWSVDEDNRWTFGYNRGSTVRTSIIDRTGRSSIVVTSDGGPVLPAGAWLCEAIVSGESVTFTLAKGTAYETVLSWGSFVAKGTKAGIHASVSTISAARGWPDIYAEAA